MDLHDWLLLLIAAGLNIPAITSLILGWKKLRAEKKSGELQDNNVVSQSRETDKKAQKLDAEISSQYAQLARETAEELLERNDRIKVLEEKAAKIDELEKRIEQLTKDLEKERNARIKTEVLLAKYQNWSYRLIRQMVEKSNLIPVPMEPAENEGA